MAHTRVKCARRLASMLTNDTNVQVAVCFRRDLQRYEVRWHGGPIEDFMQSLARGHAYEVPDLLIGELLWVRARDERTSR